MNDRFMTVKLKPCHSVRIKTIYNVVLKSNYFLDRLFVEFL